MDLATAVARKLVAESAPGLAGLLDVERQEEATCESSEASRRAASAIGLAAWDLAGKQAGVPCADLWGRPAGRDSLECYASALWLDKSPAALIAEARMHRRNNYRSTDQSIHVFPPCSRRLQSARFPWTGSAIDLDWDNQHPGLPRRVLAHTTCATLEDSYEGPTDRSV